MNPFKKIVKIFNNKEIILKYKKSKYDTDKVPYAFVYYTKNSFPTKFEIDHSVFEILLRYDLLDETGGNWEEHTRTYVLDLDRLKSYFNSIKLAKQNLEYNKNDYIRADSFLKDYEKIKSKFNFLNRKFSLDKLIEET